jgi:hypothetical protein
MVFTIQVCLACSSHTHTLPWNPSLFHHSCAPCCEGTISCLAEHKIEEAATQLFTSAHACVMTELLRYHLCDPRLECEGSWQAVMKAVALRAFCEETRLAGPTLLVRCVAGAEASW